MVGGFCTTVGSKQFVVGMLVIILISIVVLAVALESIRGKTEKRTGHETDDRSLMFPV